MCKDNVNSIGQVVVVFVDILKHLYILYLFITSCTDIFFLFSVCKDNVNSIGQVVVVFVDILKHLYIL